jgi:hypothetical protein
MTKTEIDVLWNRALREAIEGGEEFTRYRFAAMVASAERTRADALAATIAALRDIVTSDAESKDDFIARVRAVLGACPDQRVLQAVEAEREACAQVCDEASIPHPDETHSDAQWALLKIAVAIRARGQQ